MKCGINIILRLLLWYFYYGNGKSNRGTVIVVKRVFSLAKTIVVDVFVIYIPRIPLWYFLLWGMGFIVMWVDDRGRTCMPVATWLPPERSAWCDRPMTHPVRIVLGLRIMCLSQVAPMLCSFFEKNTYCYRICSVCPFVRRAVCRLWK